MTHLSAIYTAKVCYDKPVPERRAVLELEKSRLFEKRRTLRCEYHVKIARGRSPTGIFSRSIPSE
jgi:hypothetical protein